MAKTQETTPEGVSSLLDTDLYKLTMQCAVLKHFPNVKVAYSFTNRTPHMRLTLQAYTWLQTQVSNLGQIAITSEELSWLEKTCPYLSQEYLDFLTSFRLKPQDHLDLSFDKDTASQDPSTSGTLSLSIQGLWVDTILYEVPLLALISEAYFKFVGTDWNHNDQVAKAKEKSVQLLSSGCVFSEFGSRRRRDLKTHELVMQGIIAGTKEAETNGKGWTGKLTGTSNVHLAMKMGVNPVGTVAHEWFMAIAAITDDYANANENALRHWVQTFGRGVLAIALTDTFGTSAFLRAFAKPAPKQRTKETETGDGVTYAQAFTGVRQDSGDPMAYIPLIKDFYAKQGIEEKKIVVFSDSLNVEKCLQLQKATMEAGLTPSFGVGTFFTNDFQKASKPDEKSVPLNIVIKLSEAEGKPAVKLSDNLGKNTGDGELVRKVKEVVGYEEKAWKEGDEAHRWDR